MTSLQFRYKIKYPKRYVSPQTSCQCSTVANFKKLKLKLGKQFSQFVSRFKETQLRSICIRSTRDPSIIPTVIDNCYGNFPFRTSYSPKRNDEGGASTIFIFIDSTSAALHLNRRSVLRQLLL